MSLCKRKEIESSQSSPITSKAAKNKNDTKKVLKKIQRTSNSAVFDVLNKYTNSELPDNNVNNNNNHADFPNSIDLSNSVDLSNSSTMIDDNNILQDNKRMDHSPTKEELKKMLFETRKELKKRSLILKEIDKDSSQLNPSEDINDLEMDIENSQSEIINPLNNVDDDNDIEVEEEFEATDTQLYGKNFEPKMVHIKDNFYCRNAIYYAALGNSHRSSHMVRRLLTGVFKTKTLINCTLTGQTPRAQGKDRQNVKVSFLHLFVIKAIVDFSIEYGAKHGWTTQTEKDLYRTITQRIREIKREARNE